MTLKTKLGNIFKTVQGLSQLQTARPASATSQTFSISLDVNSQISLAQEGGHGIIWSAALHAEGLHLFVSGGLDFQQAVVRPLPLIYLHYSLHLLYTLVFRVQRLRDEENRSEFHQRWSATRAMRPESKATVPSLVSLSSSLRSLNHCCQSGASCSFCSSFSSSSLLPFCLDASEDGALCHHYLQVLPGSLYSFKSISHLLPGGTLVVLPLQHFQVLLQTEHSQSCSWEKKGEERRF